MNVNFNGYDENVLTFEAGTNLKTAGVPVKMTDDGKVTACTSGEVFCGICLSLRGGYATVQLKGYVTMPAKSKSQWVTRSLLRARVLQWHHQQQAESILC